MEWSTSTGEEPESSTSTTSKHRGGFFFIPAIAPWLAVAGPILVDQDWHWHLIDAGIRLQGAGFRPNTSGPTDDNELILIAKLGQNRIVFERGGIADHLVAGGDVA